MCILLRFICVVQLPISNCKKFIYMKVRGYGSHLVMAIFIETESAITLNFTLNCTREASTCRSRFLKY